MVLYKFFAVTTYEELISQDTCVEDQWFFAFWGPSSARLD